MNTFCIKGKQTFINGPRSLPRNLFNCTILDNQVFENVILSDASFAKPLPSLETCVSVNNSLCGKLVSLLESPITFDKRFKVTLVPFFIRDFNLVICKLDNFTLKVLYCYYI